MQTFLTKSSDDFDAIARELDNRRLHKQSLEAWQILMVLLELDPQGNPRAPKGWVNHPAVKMWRGHEHALYLYIQAMVAEWKSRGFKSTIDEKARATFRLAQQMNKQMGNQWPEWLYDPAIASTHRQALLVKDYAWYSQFGWPEDTGVAPTTYDYVWPVK